MEYKDIFEGWIAELKETPKDKQFLATVKFKWGKSDARNMNNRYYPDLVAAPAIVAFNSESQKGVGIVGQLDHPVNTGSTLLSHASHLITQVWKDDSKVWWADAKIMNTSRGKDLLAVLKTGAKIGASLRGIGEVDKDGKVKSGLKISAIDFVSSPSFGASATVDQSSVFESFVPEEEEYQFSEGDLNEITSAMNELNDETIALIQEKLEKDDNIEMTTEKVKALALWIRMSKENSNIAPFHEWFEKQQQLFAQNDPNLREELNEKLRRQANIKEEKRIAGFSYGVDKARIEKRQKEIDEALAGSRHDAKTISILFAEYVLAGGKLSRAEYIKKFGF